MTELMYLTAFDQKQSRYMQMMFLLYWAESTPGIQYTDKWSDPVRQGYSEHSEHSDSS